MFIKAIEVRYFFEQDQKFKVVAYDSDNFESKNLSIKDANFIGEAEFNIQNLVSKRDKSLTIDFLQNKEKRGTVTVNYEENSSEFNQAIQIVFGTEGGDFIDGNEYFFVISRLSNTVPPKPTPVMRSEILKFSQK